MNDEILPDDDAQARYFGLCVMALHDVAAMQDWGLLTMPLGQRIIDDDTVEVVMAECEERGFEYSDEEVCQKSWDFIQQWRHFNG